jgi:hypothetical protein
MAHSGDHLPPELGPIADRLREERPAFGAHELDAIKLRAIKRAARTPGIRLKGQLMKSRIALTALVAVGLMMSGTGATLAITGSSGSGNAAVQQYQTVSPDEANNDDGTTLGTDVSGGPQPVAETQQVAATTESSDSLPFTGFVAIPLILAGIALLTTGVFMRRKADG